MKVRDCMTANPVVFTGDTPLLDAVHTLVQKRISGAPVVDQRGNLIGVLSERDFLKAVVIAGYHGERGRRVRDYMSEKVEAVHADDGLFDVASQFVKTKFRRFPVIEDNRVVGLVARRDVLRALIRAFDPQTSP
jgi:CBS domain-containing protein